MTALKPETVICVGAVVQDKDRVLLVRQARGHPLEGQWTIPWGLLDTGESPVACALRETKEESSIQAAVDGLLGVQELPEPWTGWTAIVYLCHSVGGSCHPDGRETDAAAFFSLTELEGFGEPVEPWCGWLVRRVLGGNSTVIRSDPSNPYQPCVGFP
jgi:8-oxo-dGTP diphosphatase